MIFRQISATVLCAAAIMPTCVPGQQITGKTATFAGATVIQWIETERPVPQAMRDAIIPLLADGTYYGAFAIAPNDDYSSAVGATNIAAAREIALARCGARNEGCVIIAELFPEDYAPVAEGMITLSAAQTAEFLTAGRGSFRAMAIGDDGAMGLVWGYASQAEADSAALADCTARIIEQTADLRAMPCRLTPDYSLAE